MKASRRIVDAAWELFYEKGYDDTTVDDIIRLSETSKGSFYYYFSSKDSLLDTLSTILDENYAKLEDELDPEMNSFDKLMYLNYRSHSFMEQKIDVALLSSLYSTQLIAKGNRNLLDTLLSADLISHMPLFYDPADQLVISTVLIQKIPVSLGNQLC